MLGPVLLFIGYSLIYGAVANGGKFATDPWNGLFADAYVDLGGGAVGAAAGAALGNVGSTPASNAPSSGASGSAVGVGIGNIPNFSRPRRDTVIGVLGNANSNPTGTPSHGGTF